MKQCGNFILMCIFPVSISFLEFANYGCPHGWHHYQSSCYYFSTDSLNWFLAEGSCRGHNSRLAEVYEKDQSDYLLGIARSLGGPGYWLGGRDDVIEGEWIWASSDRIFSFSAWYPGEPSNGGNGEDCVFMSGGFNMLWNDISCKESARFICEKPLLSDAQVDDEIVD